MVEAAVGDEDKAEITEDVHHTEDKAENEITEDSKAGADNLTDNKVVVTNNKAKRPRPLTDNNNPTDNSQPRRVTDSNIKSSIYSLNR